MKELSTNILIVCLLSVFFGCNSFSSSLADQNPDSLYFHDVTSTHFPLDPEAHILNPVLVDIDGDGDLDVIMALEMDYNRLYLNDGNGKFTWMKDVFSKVKNDTEHVRIADFDNDGNWDVFSYPKTIKIMSTI